MTNSQASDSASRTNHNDKLQHGRCFPAYITHNRMGIWIASQYPQIRFIRTSYVFTHTTPLELTLSQGNVRPHRLCMESCRSSLQPVAKLTSAFPCMETPPQISASGEPNFTATSPFRSYRGPGQGSDKTSWLQDCRSIHSA